MKYGDSEITPAKSYSTVNFGVSEFSGLFSGVLACALLDRHNTDYLRLIQRQGSICEDCTD